MTECEYRIVLFRPYYPNYSNSQLCSNNLWQHWPTGDKEQVTLDDREHLPYSEAVMNEVWRFCNILPVTAPKISPCPVKIGHLELPANIQVTSSTYSVHMDQSYWGDPEVFRPVLSQTIQTIRKLVNIFSIWHIFKTQIYFIFCWILLFVTTMFQAREVHNSRG